jgi:uncharacterized protein
LLPAQDRHRIVGYDLARGIAIFGMILINFKMIFSTNQTTPVFLIDFMEFINRRAAATLVMVAGVGMTLLSRGRVVNGKRQVRPGTRKDLFKRACFLFAAGYLLSMTWQGDILHFYGVFIGIGICFLTASNRAVLSAAGSFFMVGVVLYSIDFDTIRQGLPDLFLIDEMVDILFTGYYPVFPWTAFLLGGIWFGRQYVSTPLFKRNAWVWALVMFVMSEIGSRIVICLGHVSKDLPVDFAALILGMQPWVMIDLTLPSPLSVISAFGTSMIVILFSMRTCERLGERWRSYWTAAGKTSLTLYVFHIVFVINPLMMLGVSHNKKPEQVILGAIVFFFFYSTFARMWLNRYEKGPLEIVMRAFPFFAKSADSMKIDSKI